MEDKRIKYHVDQTLNSKLKKDEAIELTIRRVLSESRDEVRPLRECLKCYGATSNWSVFLPENDT